MIPSTYPLIDVIGVFKSCEIKDFGQINQLKGIINTGKMASALYSETQSNFKNYDSTAAVAKQLLNPDEAKTDNAESQKIANSILDGIGL